MRRALLCCLALTWAAAASAEAPFQFTAPNVRAPDNPDVNGVRLSLFHGENRNVRGFDLGLLSLSEASYLSGFSLVAGMSRIKGNMDGGVAISLINFHEGKDKGLNAAFINRVNNADDAVDIGFVNIATGGTMLDIGGLNVSKRSTAQLGFINVTKEIKGFQFGFVNIAENGFLPVFPVFNFPKRAPSGGSAR